MNTLKGHVKVIRELPQEFMEKYNNISNITFLKVPAWASANYYLEEVQPILENNRYVIHYYSQFTSYTSAWHNTSIINTLSD